MAGDDASPFDPPAIALPKGGGAIRGIDEKVQINPATGTGSLVIPIAASAGRGAFGPQLQLRYDSGAGNGPFGLGWSLSLPAVTRKTDRGVPRYDDRDTFIFAGAEDLVPLTVEHLGWARHIQPRTLQTIHYRVERYRPRVEGAFARIERWTAEDGEVHWRTISPANVTSLYGRDDESRIFDPHDRRRVYSWLLCESRDDRGNAMVVRYRAEDSAGVDVAAAHERNRTDLGRSAQRYLKRVLYGNRTSALVQPDLTQTDWAFELVFDYGEHHADVPRPLDAAEWVCRADPFSNYRPGFELRTHRLCQRTLMFHHFPGVPEVGRDCCVRSTRLEYRDLVGDGAAARRGDALGTFLARATQVSHRREGAAYRTAEYPPLELEYTRSPGFGPLLDVEDEGEVRPSSAQQMIDLDGEGLPGTLIQAEGAWYYRRNLGEGRFSHPERLSHIPSPATLRRGQQQLLDLSGGGALSLVDLAGPLPGFTRRDGDSWRMHQPFAELPNLDWQSGNLRFLDLDGDGRADILVTEQGGLRWHPSLGERGFGPAERALQSFDEERGPRLVFADGEQSIYVADMSGDGLPDLVRIRDGEVCYWPSLGHGRFGPKVTMDGAPVLAPPGLLDRRRILLADVDGSGTTDLIYAGADGVRVYFNQAGNAWTTPHVVPGAPPVDSASELTTADVLGRGTACLLWSTPLPAERRRRYLDLTGGIKPHLLAVVRNNLGAETHLSYAPSTRDYLADRAAGRPWATRLPFPVHVVAQVDTIDRITGNRFTRRYAYHHGYYEAEDRELRGFGLHEQWDTELLSTLEAPNARAASHVPPVLTRTWLHTGAYLERERLEYYYRDEYAAQSAAPPQLLPDTPLPALDDVEEVRQAVRALKGATLRQEVFALDTTGVPGAPLSVTESSYALRRLQPRTEQAPAVFLRVPAETITSRHEGASEARITHSWTLEVDPWGNTLRAATVAHGRTTADITFDADTHLAQQRTFATGVENLYTWPVDEDDAYRTPLLCESQRAELCGLPPLVPGDAAWPAALTDALAHGALLEAHRPAHPLTIEKRILSCQRTYYRRDNLAGALALRDVAAHGIADRSYSLALTPNLVGDAFGGRVSEDMLRAAGYLQLPGDDRWWLPSGRISFIDAAQPTAAQELSEARQHFFVSRRYIDPAGAVTRVRYDADDLLIRETVDPLGNVLTAGERDGAGALVVDGNDYRLMLPRQLMDTNRNRVAVAFDTRGHVVGTAVMGKPEPPEEGDSLAGFVADLDPAVAAAHLAAPLANPALVLGSATTRMIYDLFAYWDTRGQPAPRAPVVYSLARTTHAAPGGATDYVHSYSYSDGQGREIQKKIRAEDGRLVPGGPVQAPRWVGSGWQVLDNKGQTIRSFQPFFSASHALEQDRRVGASAIHFFDPAGRRVGIAHPHHAYEKVRFDAWSTENWDVHDTVELDPRLDAQLGEHFRRLPDADYLPTWREPRAASAVGTAERAAYDQTHVHRATPTRVALDAHGRGVVSVAHNRWLENGQEVEATSTTRMTLDADGRTRAVTDALHRVVARYTYDLLGRTIHAQSLDAGERWTLTDARGLTVRGWDSRDHHRELSYDAGRRLVEVRVAEGTGQPRVVERRAYGEDPAAPADNFRGKLWRQWDGAGRVEYLAYDFKGNVLRSERRLAEQYRDVVDWSGAPVLQGDAHVTITTHDAMSRPTTTVHPDGSRVSLTYNVAGLVEEVTVRRPGAAADDTIVSGSDYDARGHIRSVDLGNGARVEHDYDEVTDRLTAVRTLRGAALLQDLRYSYDATGNIIRVVDAVAPDTYFNNIHIGAQSDYVFDAHYRLREATGREHLGQVGGAPIPLTDDDGPRARRAHPGDGQAMGRYVERYRYDAVGNLLELTHRGTDPAHPGWSRAHSYAAPSRIDPTQRGNRLSSTQLDAQLGLPYAHDEHGNMLAMPHVPTLRWDHTDRLARSARQVVEDGTPETTYYVYAADGARIRKVTDWPAAANAVARRRTETIYLGALEIVRDYDGDGDLQLERRNLQLTGATTSARIERRTEGMDLGPALLIRHQIGNHLGSAMLELDGGGALVSYEEYYPYGSTAYQAVRSQVEVPRSRRWAGRERDAETDLYFIGARYYSSWLGRWISGDPSGIGDGTNTYQYASSNPIVYGDATGRETSLFSQIAGAVVEHVKADVGVVYGVGEKVVEMGMGLGQMVANPVGTSINLGRFLVAKYQEGAKTDGVVGGLLTAANELNPVYHLLVDGYEAVQAFERGESFEGGRRLGRAMVGVVETLAVAAGGAAAVTKGASAINAARAASAARAAEATRVAEGAAAAEKAAEAGQVARAGEAAETSRAAGAAGEASEAAQAGEAAQGAEAAQAQAAVRAAESAEAAQSSGVAQTSEAAQGAEAATGANKPSSLSGATDSEIDAAVNAAGESDLLLEAPAPNNARYNIVNDMMTNEHAFPAKSSAPGATGNVQTKVRVHTADPTAPAGSNSATGNTVTITQGGGTRRWIPGKGWQTTSLATGAEMDASHIPIHR